MTLKLTIQYSENKDAVAYVANDARVLVGSNIVAAKEATSVSILSDVHPSNDNLLHASNTVILPIRKIEQVDGVVASYIDPEKKHEFTMPVLGVFVPKKEPIKENESKYKLYFAMMTECE